MKIFGVFKKRGNHDSVDIQEGSHLSEDAALSGAKVMHQTEEGVIQILVYGIEKFGVLLPGNKIINRNFNLEFEQRDTNKRFHEYDGVILFQGCFESFSRDENWMIGRPIQLDYDKNELDKRLNETKLLLKKGGFICFLLCGPIIDGKKGGQEWSGTDLAKVYLNMSSFYRTNFPSRTTAIRCVRGEFDRFLELYGAAWTHFQNFNENIPIKPIALVGSRLAGMIMWDERFFIPTLLPEVSDERTTEFFTLLADALVGTRKKLIFEIPEWANEFSFPREESLLEEKEQIIGQIEDINQELDGFRRFKMILIQSGEQLVDTTADIFEKGFGIPVETIDEYREDLKILNDETDPLVFCEVKGVNRGVKREHINQTDSHRERADLAQSFPAVLIINSHIKNARSLHEKDQDVPIDHVVHAKKNNVLIIRTLDLLRLLRLKLERDIPKEEIIKLLTGGGGWLRVTNGEWELIDDPNSVSTVAANNVEDSDSGLVEQ